MKFVIFLGKTQEKNALEANIGSFSFMTKDLSQIKVYTYFNIEYTKTLVKLKEKLDKFSGVVHIPIFKAIYILDRLFF